jgi:hypothetical protein
MSRNKAAFTQSGVCRILNASRKTGVEVRVTLPDGTVIQTTPGDARAANENIRANDFGDLLNDKAAAQVRQ